MKSLMELSVNFFEMLELDYQGSKCAEAENDKICFENAIKRFLKSGRKEDAFTVYFCFCEIFELFGKGYENTKKLLELMSDHEFHSGKLLSKHRDHYSHSVYVFALGLAIYANDIAYRAEYLKFYGLEDSKRSAFQFLKFWGMTALFHDIGYPFQLAHEQIKSYVEEVWVDAEKDVAKKASVRATVPYVSYGNMQNFLAIGEAVKEKLSKTFSVEKRFNDLNDLLAYGLKVREGCDEEYVNEILLKRVVQQPNFMDHGYFSAVILARHLFSVPNETLSIELLDVLTAILLHNNFYKFDVPNGHPIDISDHPLSYLLILCDELQCWDRLAYGKISKRDPIAWDVKLEINENRIAIRYLYDSYFVRLESDSGDTLVVANKNYDGMTKHLFEEKIFGSLKVKGEQYVKEVKERNSKEKDKKKQTKLYKGYIASSLNLDVQTEEVAKPRKTKLYASDDSFVNICDLAKAIHISYDRQCRGYSKDYINKGFGDLTLQFKVSNIEQAKSYAEKLELINCFYSSKDLDYPQVEDFRRVEFSGYKDNLEFLCREEHVRWVKEKLAMGWRYGTDYDINDRAERDSKKISRALVPYEMLSCEDKAKDELMITNIFKLLKKFDSDIKIYNYRSGHKPELNIAGMGHRFIKGDKNVINQYKKQIKEILEGYSKDYRVVVRTCFGFGADQLIAECAVELGLTVKAYLPMEYEDFIEDVRQDNIANGRQFTEKDELRMRHLLAQTVVCKTIPDPVHTYAAASRYIVEKSERLIALWDKKDIPLEKDGKPINRGGTYDAICMARQSKRYREEDIHIIVCER